MPKRVTGIGGIFFKSQNSQALQAWYQKHLGIKIENGCATFKWPEGQTPTNPGSTIWAAFQQDTQYFAPSTKDFMINYRVENLDELLAQLKQEGVTVEPHPQTSEYGKFAWIMDPEGNRIELWQPPAGM